MKRIIYIASILSILNTGIGWSKEFSAPEQTVLHLAQIKTLANTQDDDRFKNWTEEQYKHYEDSAYAKLYPPVRIEKADSAVIKALSNVGGQAKLQARSVTNTHVPTSYAVNTSLEVGQIAVKSGTSPSGAKIYEIPINIYPGMKGFQPNLSLTYNSQQGNSVVGVGWSISGLPSISRGGKSIYYDGKTQGVSLDNNDSFVLDGIRLVKLATYSGYILYESEQGNIKAKGYYSGNIMKYFEVFYPEGNKGVFGYTTNSINELYYPITSMTDLNGNKILYAYDDSDFHYRIRQISYNGSSVVFSYTSRKDPLISFCGGYKVYESQLLNSISCNFGTQNLGTYSLSYTTQNNVSLLTKVDYAANGKSYNPLLFMYGEGKASGFTKSTTQLYEWYVADNPSSIKVSRGKFDYDSDADGLIALPNLNPYWKHYRNSTMFRHSQNRFENKYTGDEKIFLYAGLNDSWASAMPNLKTELGFVDILCADIEGKQEEYVIKINDLVVNDNDQVTFTVYRSNLYTGLGKLYSRTYSFPTVYKDADGKKSIQPKFYYTGDFNGDGKMEILAVSVHQPFGDTSKPSKCYIFDLPNNKILYQGHVLPFNVEFVGVQQLDPKAAANHTDKLLAMDYDGDGKTDLCHINENGVNVYTFDAVGSSISARKVMTYTGLNKGGLENRDILVGEYNGDGMMDLLVSPASTSGGGYSWTMYNSMGNGLFSKSSFSGTFKSSQDNTGFIVQDINGDGKTDLVKYDTSGFFTYLAKDNNVGSSVSYDSYPTSKSVLVPTDINGHNNFSQMVCLKDGKVTKYSFTRNDTKESMMTGLVNSLGVVEKNEYHFINETENIFNVYTKGYDAQFPYVNIQEPLAVINATETYMNGNLVDNNYYTYRNAVFHRQGLGFRGFDQITHIDKRGYSTVQTFKPYNFSLPESEISPESEKHYTYAVSTQSNKISKILLTEKLEKDLLKGFTATSTYTYDTYGFPTSENISYSDGYNVKYTNTYSSYSTVTDGYNLGYLTDRTITKTKGNSTYSEREYIPAQTKRQPFVKVYYINGKQSKQYIYSYDTYGNPISEVLKLYESKNNTKTVYLYDNFGRLAKVTNPMGLIKEYAYDNYGRVDSIKDHRGGLTAFSYDAFGRETLINYPDKTNKSTTYAWSSEGTNGLYAVSTFQTGKPTTIKVYDALNREVRNGETRFNGSVCHIDKLYDSYGNVEKQSLPFFGNTPSLWNNYSYDDHNRILSCKEASGKETTYAYSGNNVTTVENNILTTRTYDSQNNLVSVTDPTGSVTYNLDVDGQPSSVVVPGNITTSFSYDQFRRRIGISDPSKGYTAYEYDADGNVSKETDANGKSISYEYDMYGRLVKKAMPEFTSTYSYNAINELVGVTSTNGTSKSYVYDSFGRVQLWKGNTVDGVWLQKEYTYLDGNVSSVKYTTKSDVLATENHIYANGHLRETNLNGTETIFKLLEENPFGQPTKIMTGNITRNYNYTPYGLPTGRKAAGSSTTYQDFSYVFDPVTSNLKTRRDNKRKLTEDFTYDGINRLTSYGDNSVTYDIKGNITNKSDVGTFKYGLSNKPYAVSEVDIAGNAVPYREQEITYTSFSRPNTISENNYTASFVYDDESERVRMVVSDKNTNLFSRYYLGGCYELYESAQGVKESLYLSGGYYDAPAVCIKSGSVSQVFYILRDYLGSVIQVVTANGSLVQELSYDAWGRLRDPDTHDIYKPGKEPELFLGRGYTGHEHLTQFGLINMNARLYDPALGRFLSPDPYVQMPDMPQNFNRYSYTINNPLLYKDSNGEFFLFTIFNAVTDFFGNMVNHGFNVSQYNWTRTVNAWKIDMGMFKGNFGQILNKWTYGIANSIIGNLASQVCNTIGLVDGVTDMDGMLALSGVTKNQNSAFTIGHYSLGPKNYVADWRDHLFVHEYGHYIQTQRWGVLYFPVIAIPSLASATFTSKWSHMEHKDRWFEVNASNLGAKYFDKHYGQGAPGYTKNNADFFDINAFRYKNYTKYINPRLGTRHQDKTFPNTKGKIVFWDFIII